jgi:autotransporter-associated beta strand protein
MKTWAWMCRSAVAMAVVAGLMGGRAEGAAYTWNVDASANWDAGGSWNPGTDYPRLIDDIANVNNNITADRAITMGAAVSVGTLAIGDASGNSKFTLNAGSALTFDVTAGSAALTRTATGTGADTISTGITLNDPLTITINSASGSLTIGGVIGGANALTKTGAGTLILSGANTYSGATAIQGGILAILRSAT